MIFGKKREGGPAPIIKVQSDVNTSGRGRIQNFYDIEEGVTRDKFSLSVLIFSIFSVFLQGVLILINWKKFPPELPLFYSQPWGEKMLARPLFLFVLPIIVFVFTALNYWILISTWENIFLRRIITTFTFLGSFFCTYSLIKLISLLI